MARAFIGIGSNLGDRAAFVRQSVRKLRSFARVLRVSSLHETEPVGVTGRQPDFLNAVAEIETSSAAIELMGQLLSVEAEIGRIRKKPGTARRIDLDLLSYDDLVLDQPVLQVPHPRMHERRFVMEPLTELAPAWVHPVLGRTASELLGQLSRTNER
ncbi:MAG: 2-amino-4-hydroxy-6-hydroxymethyldihydropteridine diphosphokinase [Pseudomonadota bacterium]